mgnify:CR=1 FL=1
MRRLIFVFILLILVFGCRKRSHEEPAGIPLPGWSAPIHEKSTPVTPTSASKDLNFRFPFETVVHFEFDKAEVLGHDVTKVSAAAVILGRAKGSTCNVYGHCDEIGTAEYNLALGQRRADAVGLILIRRGIASDRIRCVSFGEEKPVSKVHSENRRAEIKVGGKGCP